LIAGRSQGIDHAPLLRADGSANASGIPMTEAGLFAISVGISAVVQCFFFISTADSSAVLKRVRGLPKQRCRLQGLPRDLPLAAIARPPPA
jgi:hypothetical protein